MDGAFPCWRSLSRPLKTLALLAVPACWLAFGWGGALPLSLLLLHLAAAHAAVSLAALAAAAATLVLQSLGAGFFFWRAVPLGGVVLGASALASLALGGRLAAPLHATRESAGWAVPWLRRWRKVCAVIALAALGAIPFRGVDPVAAPCLAMMFFLMWRALRGTPRSRAPWSSALLLACSLALSLLMLEGGARLALPRIARTADAFAPDRDYIFLLQPGGRGEHIVPLSDTREFSVPLDISGQGIRDRHVPPKEPGEFRIAMLGDSFTMGYAVKEEASIPRLLEEKLKVALPGAPIRVINCGLAGAGVLQELGMLRKRAFPLEPDLVILQLFPGNDVDNALEVVNKRQRAYFGSWHDTLSEYRLKNLPQVRAERWAFQNLRAYHALRLATRKRWVHDAIEQLRWVEPFDDSAEPSENRPDALEVDLAEYYPELEEGMGIMEEYVLRMRAECAERGIDFMAYCVPAHCELSDQLMREATSWMAPPVRYERLKALNRLNAFFATHSIPHVSVVEALRNAGPVEDTYYLLDGHLTPKGNAAVANVWTRFLAGDYLKRRMPQPPEAAAR